MRNFTLLPQMQITCEIGEKKPKHYIFTCKRHLKQFYIQTEQMTGILP